MTSWLLQASNGFRLPSMSFMRDVTIGEGESVPPMTTFTKTWTIQNSGAEVTFIVTHIRYFLPLTVTIYHSKVHS